MGRRGAGGFDCGDEIGVSSVNKAVSSRGDGVEVGLEGAGGWTEPLDDHKNARERVGVLVGRSLVRYRREEHADVIGFGSGQRGHEAHWCERRRRRRLEDGWRPVIGCSHLWRKQP